MPHHVNVDYEILDDICDHEAHIAESQKTERDGDDDYYSDMED